MASVPTKDHLLRNQLEPYEDTRIEVEGYYDASKAVYDQKKRRNIQTVLFQDAIAYVDGKEIAMGHAWIQAANSIVNLKCHRDDKVRFTARVNRYMKNLDVPNADGLMQEWRFGLADPEGVEVTEKAKPKTVSGVLKGFDELAEQMTGVWKETNGHGHVPHIAKPVPIPPVVIVPPQPVVTAPPPPPQVDVLALLGELKPLADQIGKKHVEAVLPHLEALVAIAEKAGGADKLTTMLKFLV